MNNLMRYLTLRLRRLNGRFSRFWTVATAAPNHRRPSKWCWWVRTATSTPSCAATWNSSPANRPTGRITSASTSYRSAADPTPSPATWPLSIDTTTSTSSPIHGVKVSHYPTGTSLSLSLFHLFVLFYFVLFCFILLLLRFQDSQDDGIGHWYRLAPPPCPASSCRSQSDFSIYPRFGWFSWLNDRPNLFGPPLAPPPHPTPVRNTCPFSCVSYLC